jgi:hypothetical protein
MLRSTTTLVLTGVSGAMLAHFVHMRVRAGQVIVAPARALVACVVVSASGLLVGLGLGTRLLLHRPCLV